MAVYLIIFIDSTAETAENKTVVMHPMDEVVLVDLLPFTNYSVWIMAVSFDGWKSPISTAQHGSTVESGKVF